MKRIGLLITCALVALAPLFFLGCEASSSADTQLILEPRNVTLGYLQSQLFTVSGGFDYRWRLDDDRIGVLNKRTGNQVLYTSYTTNVTQTLTVESFIQGASSSGRTNNIGSNDVIGVNAFASAVISPLGFAAQTQRTPIANIHILPSNATLFPTPTGNNVNFTVAEGVSCHWSKETPGFGLLSSDEGITVTYTATVWPTSNIPLIQNITVTYSPSAGTPVSVLVPVKQQLTP